MTITFRCEHCGKKVEAPDAAGGKRGKCPYCQQSNYIPSPVSEGDILELADEDGTAGRAGDQSLVQQEQALRAALAGEGAPPMPLEHKEDLKPEDLHHLVVNYCLDMSGSKLQQAESHVAEMKKVQHTAREAVDEFLAGSVLEPALDHIPTKILHGFLTNLREQLA